MLMESSLLIPIEGVSYKTCGIIGVGGQGTVYLAKDEDDKTYAIKMIKDYNNAIVK